MKNQVQLFIAIFIAVALLVSCGPVKIEQLEEVLPSETAFLVPLEGANKTNQAKFMSIDYLNESKVATKRISMPLRKYVTGRAYFSYKWIPTMKIIKVNRTPVTREWTGKAETGTNTRNEALWVESADSIGFGVGVNVTAMVKEEDAATFLYYFSGKPLSQVVDENVRGKVNSILSREFAAHNLEKARKMKNEVFGKAAKETIESFTTMGVTITNLGLAEGLVYADSEIQQAINNAFKAEMLIQVEEQNNLAQKQVNARNVGIAKAEADAAIEFAKAAKARTSQVELEIRRMKAQAQLTFAEKLGPGVLPSNILPQGSSMLFGLDKPAIN